MRPRRGWNLKWSRRNTLGGVQWYSGWLVSVGVDVARLRLDSLSRVAFSLLLSVNLTTISLLLCRNPFHFSVHIPSPSISLRPIRFSVFLYRIRFFSVLQSLRPYLPFFHLCPFPFLFLTPFHTYYRGSRTFSRRCPPSREHKIQSGILISPPLCRAVPVPTDYFDPA